MFEEEQLGFSKCHRILDPRLIRFAHQTAMQLNDPTLKRYPSFRFPGGLPITIEEKHVKKIKTTQYWFTAKADGFRVLLCFFMYYIDGEWQRFCIKISRDASCHVLAMDTPTELYENGGSLFDGELVSTKSGWWDILLFDCYSFKGTNMRSLPLSRRFARCKKLSETYNHREIDSVRLVAKSYYRLSTHYYNDAIAFLSNSNHNLEYDTDGIILVPPGKSECSHGRDETQFKMKMEHTIDLILVQDTDDKELPFYLSSYDETDDSYVIKQQISISKLGNPKPNTVFECRIVTVEGIHTFIPLKERSDKTQANSENVLKRTLQTINDNIQVGSLMCSDSQEELLHD